MSTPSAKDRARRSALALAGVTLLAVAVITIVVVVFVLRGKAATPTSPRPTEHISASADTTQQWDTTAENGIAAQPMLVLPPQAAQPHPLSTQSAGSPIILPTGFPATVVGALAQLKALDESGLSGGDPAVYARAYRQLSLPGAPDVRTTGLWALLTSFRAHAGLSDIGPAAGFVVTFDATEGLTKGSADSGRYTVACVLGELTVQDQNQTRSLGIGDCQALRWTGAEWRISPGALAAAAPCAWPGSVESVDAGYRELT